MQDIVQESLPKVILVDRYTYADRHMQSRHIPMQSKHRQVHIGHDCRYTDMSRVYTLMYAEYT